MNYLMIKFHKNLSLLIFAAFVCACDDMLDVSPTGSVVERDVVFSDDIMATASVTGIYGNLYSNVGSFASGSRSSVTAIAGLSGQELRYHSDDVAYLAFQEYAILSDNSIALGLWKSMYESIYSANSAIESLRESESISPDTRMQLLGEAIFIRAFCYFYLVNLFGEVPLVRSTDFNETSVLKRSPAADVYDFIIEDLRESLDVISSDYPTIGRVRPNKAAVQALLARVYLFVRDWDNASFFSGEVISDARYGMPELDSVFLGSSREAIWQLMPLGQSENTNEGKLFWLFYAPLYQDKPYSLSDSLVSSFEADDLRRGNWIGVFSEGDVEYFFPIKYKVPDGGLGSNPVVPLTEYSMVFRLSEQYLIRAEARAYLDDFLGAVQNLNVVRERAGLQKLSEDVSLYTLSDLVEKVSKERRCELFSEWGHRWLDLKRMGKTEVELSAMPGWKLDAELYPIPQQDIDRNPALLPQNDGY